MRILIQNSNTNVLLPLKYNQNFSGNKCLFFCHDTTTKNKRTQFKRLNTVRIPDFYLKILSFKSKGNFTFCWNKTKPDFFVENIKLKIKTHL